MLATPIKTTQLCMGNEDEKLQRMYEEVTKNMKKDVTVKGVS